MKKVFVFALLAALAACNAPSAQPPVSVAEDWPTVDMAHTSTPGLDVVPIDVRIGDKMYAPLCDERAATCGLYRDLNETGPFAPTTIALPADGLLPLFVRMPDGELLHLFVDRDTLQAALINHAHPKRKQ